MTEEWGGDRERKEKEGEGRRREEEMEGKKRISLWKNEFDAVLL